MEIKFRAWLSYDNGGGEMLPNVQNHINGKWVFGHIVLGNVDNVSEPMQYTGLKDCNGKEIYVGDIVKDNIGIGVIIYSENYAAFKVSYRNKDMPRRGKWFMDYLDRERKTLEVIGNIYENGDLLEGVV